MYSYFLTAFLVLLISSGEAQPIQLKKITVMNAGAGWAGNSINTVIFRKNSLTSNDSIQFVSYYSNDGYVLIGKRRTTDTAWLFTKTSLKGNISDAHNSISIMLDGDGFLHIAWNQHNNRLHYCRSKEPLLADFGDMMPMTGSLENKVTYPEFYKLPGGDLLFFYRDGGSGNGNLVINRYYTKERKWEILHSNLIDGEGKRNAYWQACVDAKGSIHISWVWRESPDVVSNHDMCYAVSKDGGINWQKSTGEKYKLPVSVATAEVVCAIPQNSELINQTSMSADKKGNPYIATYWKGKNDVPQYHVLYNTGGKWKVKDLGFRKAGFSLDGKGTKQIPVSRPQIIYSASAKKAILIFRDAETGNKPILAISKNRRLSQWVLSTLYDEEAGYWEPTYDIERWMQAGVLSLFFQKVLQPDREGVPQNVSQLVKVIEWDLISANL